MLGDSDPATLQARLLLARRLSQAGNHDEAVRQAADLLQASRRVHGPVHPVTMNAVIALVEVLKKAGRPTDAERAVRDGLADAGRSHRSSPRRPSGSTG